MIISCANHLLTIKRRWVWPDSIKVTMHNGVLFLLLEKGDRRSNLRERLKTKAG